MVPPKKKRSCCCSGFLILFALIVLFGGGFWIYANYFNAPSSPVKKEYEEIEDYFPPEANLLSPEIALEVQA